jgi:hypothetical protein
MCEKFLYSNKEQKSSAPPFLSLPFGERDRVRGRRGKDAIFSIFSPYLERGPIGSGGPESSTDAPYRDDPETGCGDLLLPTPRTSSHSKGGDDHP